jgi:protein O-mannosyl-transferase
MKRNSNEKSARHQRIRVLWPILVLVTAAAYQPAWHGTLLWDDDAHLTSVALRSSDGLRRIWTDIGATQQYYPIVHSTFWIFHRLWGHDTLGYHLANIVLHATSASLLFLILRRLSVPGGTLAAFAFALHPVQVESVAWMTELKNTLSGVFYLAAALAYLNFDERRRAGSYVLAALLFSLALLSKTVTATLPAAMLVVFWWKRGHLEWRRDVLPLTPFVLAGIAAGAMTAWFERSVLGAQGLEYSLSAVERVLLAGRALWFYLATLLWPVNLSFIYPRWRIAAEDWWQFAFPAAAIAVLWAGWLIRSRTRAPLAAALLFCGTLVPALGFVDVYPFRYSFVADHFQYLATIPAIAALSAALTLAASRLAMAGAAAQRLLVIVVAGPLALTTWSQSRVYADSDTLFRATLARNPDCWLCHNNLATAKLFGSEEALDEAIAHIQEALRLNPSSAEAHNNLGGAFQRKGRLLDALNEHRAAARLNPKLPDAHYNIGVTSQSLGRAEDAAAAYGAALQLNPSYAAAHNNLGTVLQGSGRVEEARTHFAEAVRLEPDAAQSRLNLGSALQRLGRIDEAIDQYREAVRLEPRSATAHVSLGLILAAAGRSSEAIAGLERALTLEPGSPSIRTSLGYVLLQSGSYADAMTQFRQAIRIEPGFAPAHYQLGIALATSGQPAEAIGEFEQALRYQPGAAEIHNDLGAALANAGRIRDAVTHFSEALRLRPNYPDARANLEKAKALVAR